MESDKAEIKRFIRLWKLRMFGSLFIFIISAIFTIVCIIKQVDKNTPYIMYLFDSLFLLLSFFILHETISLKQGIAMVLAIIAIVFVSGNTL